MAQPAHALSPGAPPPPPFPHELARAGEPEPTPLEVLEAKAAEPGADRKLPLWVFGVLALVAVLVVGFFLWRADGVQRSADRLSARYGVSVLLADDAPSAGASRRALSVVERALASYPPALIDREVDSIVIAREPAPADVIKPGVMRIATAPGGRGQSRDALARGVHAQAAGMILDAYGFPRAGWSMLNPPGFAYAPLPPGAAEAPPTPVDWVEGFASPRARKSLRADVGEMAALAMMEPTVITDAARRFPSLRAKYVLLRDAYLGVSPEFARALPPPPAPGSRRALEGRSATSTVDPRRFGTMSWRRGGGARCCGFWRHTWRSASERVGQCSPACCGSTWAACARWP